MNLLQYSHPAMLGNCDFPAQGDGEVCVGAVLTTRRRG